MGCLLLLGIISPARAGDVPDDPRFLDGTLWGLNNWGQNDGIPGADIKALEGWALQTSASNVIVAILDTGIRYSHEDLASNVWRSPIDGSHGINAIAESNDPFDDEGHGTLVAGIIGAVGNNGLGGVGVAWQVQLMACKCLNHLNEGSDASVVASLEFAMANGARIVNASLTSTVFSEPVSNALVRLRDAGIIVVAPAGDNASDIDATPVYPACYDLDNIVSVTSFAPDDCLGFNANYGMTNVDLAAPGDRIFSTYFAADDSYHPITYPWNAGYGTSFAAAYVSGSLALIVQRYPDETHQQIIERLQRSTDHAAELNGKCVTGGRLNLRKALSPPMHLLPIGGGESSVQLHASVGFNRAVVIEASTNLFEWSPVLTNQTTTNWSFEFVEIRNPDAEQHYFRAISAP